MDSTNALAVFQHILNQIDSGGDQPPPSLPPNRGGDNGGGMEPRIAKLEAHMDHVRADILKLADVPTNLATLKKEVEHLPGKGFVVTAAISTVAGVTALLVLLQRIGLLQ